MQSLDAHVEHLTSEYAYLGKVQSESDVVGKLVAEHDWTPDAARKVLDLAEGNGVFLLRNALALAIVRDIHDGQDGI